MARFGSIWSARRQCQRETTDARKTNSFSVEIVLSRHDSVDARRLSERQEGESSRALSLSISHNHTMRDRTELLKVRLESS